MYVCILQDRIAAKIIEREVKTAELSF